MRRSVRQLVVCAAVASLVGAGLLGTPSWATGGSAGQEQPARSASKPVITKVSPAHGGDRGGRTVTITGRHLSGARQVTFGGARGTHLVVRSASKITVTSPKHAPGPVHVRVVTAGGRSKARSADSYLFTSLDWTAVAQGSEDTCGLRSDHTLWCWGYGSMGDLGLGDYNDRYTPALVGTRHWRQISLARNHACGITTAGALYCWGSNDDGELGLGDQRLRQRPTKVGSQTWRQVDVGDTHACAVRQDRTLWCWGGDTDGQLGVGDKSPRLRPTRVGSDASWSQASAGQIHSCALRTDGSLWCWGDGFSGATGQGLLAADTTSPTRVGSGTSWLDVGAGQDATCARQQDDGLWCWGLNSNGQLGLGDYDDRGAPVRVGSNTWTAAQGDQGEPCAVSTDHGLWCWGGPGFQSLLNATQSNTPVHVGHLAWTAVSTGYDARCAIRVNASLWCWGYNYHGGLGVGDDTSRTGFVHVVTR